jgi:DNA/RNA-binding domain of Phe-tRNA-synthetase-like protein
MSPFTPAIGAEIFDLRPDYSAISVVAEGIDNAANHPATDRYVEELMTKPAPPPWAEGHLEAWRAAYRAFGAKPQRTPCSAETLLKRLGKDGRLPAINAVVDLYNAVSVRYALPVGGENIAAYVGNPRLMRASGAELFETTKEGEAVSETIPSGEVVWADEHGVTCRRWNWRQGIRTRIDPLTRRMWFVLERLEPMPLAAAKEAAAALMRRLRQISPGVQLNAHLIDRRGATEILVIGD